MSTKTDNNRRGLAIVALQGGLGNQLFQFCAGLHLLSSTKNRVFFFQKFSFNIGVKRRSLAIQALLQELKCFKYLSLFLSPLMLFGMRFKLRFALNISSELGSSKIDSRFILLNGWFQSYKLVSEVHDSLIKRFENSSVYAPLVHVERINAVGVHLRFGDYENSLKTREYHGLTANSYFDEAIGFLKLKMKHIDKVIFVTDDLDRARNTVEVLLSCRDSTPIEVISSNPVEDMTTLSSCSGIVLSNSSFSWWAGYLGSSLRSSSVVAPKPWLAFESEFDQSLVSPNWHFIKREILAVGGCNPCIH